MKSSAQLSHPHSSLVFGLFVFSVSVFGESAFDVLVFEALIFEVLIFEVFVVSSLLLEISPESLLVTSTGVLNERKEQVIITLICRKC